MSTLQWEWQQQYQVALLEMNPLNFAWPGRHRGKSNLVALGRTSHALRRTSERQAIEYAMRGLSVLKREIPAIR